MKQCKFTVLYLFSVPVVPDRGTVLKWRLDELSHSVSQLCAFSTVLGRLAIEMKVFALSTLFILLASPAWATTYYLAPASGGGNDSNIGTSASTPWLTPNHPVNCGDTITAAASTSYNPFNFAQGSWGTVTCAAGNNVAWVICATFDACKISTASTYCMHIDRSYWGVQGFECTITGGQFNGCFQASPNTITPAQVHHVIFANDIANGCYGNGFGSSNQTTTIGTDYLVIIGNIAYKAAQGNGLCYSGISIYQPISSDSLPGTHLYVAGNFAWDNVVTDPCGGFNPSYDGEGLSFDTFDGSQGGLPVPYSQQAVADNNIFIFNGGSGFVNAGGGNSTARMYIRNNTLYGNDTDQNQVQAGCGNIQLQGSNGARYIEVFGNLSMTIPADGCPSGSTASFSYSVWNGNGTDHIYNNYAYNSAGNNFQTVSSAGFSYGPNNISGTNPSFANPVDPGAPSCGAASSVPNCMATVIANFTPTTAAAKTYGYQIPVTTNAYDPLFPQWLCNVNLPAGLVTMGCGVRPAPPANVSAIVN